MNVHSQTLNLYSRLLNIQKEDAKAIQALCEKQHSAVWRSLLKVQHSMHISNHNQAINQLKLSKSQIQSFVSYNNSKQNQQAYSKVLVCILANLINRLLLANKYEDALIFFKQLTQQIKNKTLLKQCLYNLFGFTSLLSLNEYNIQNNCEFKYPPETQAKFFFIIGKIKRIFSKNQQAKVAFEKILKINESKDINKIIISNTYYYLSQIEPSNYKDYFSKIKKSSKNLVDQMQQEDKYSQYILITLLKIQMKLNKLNSAYTQTPKFKQKITKQMLQMYLNSISRDKFKDLNQIFKNLKQESNTNVLQQILQSKIAEEAIFYFEKQVQKINIISLRYIFRKLFKIKINSSLLQSRLPLASNVKQNPNFKKRDRSIPQDKVRAQKILKKCMEGSQIIKINFGSKSFVKRFVKIDQKGLKWAQNKEQIQQSSSICKWKNVLGIVYGKVSQNFTKNKYKSFQSERCFSLITNQRSYDFYCENQPDIYFWLQGISYKLQLFHNNPQSYPYYSKGRALWKLMLFKMSSKYYDSKKKYKWSNAGAVLSFKKYLMVLK